VNFVAKSEFPVAPTQPEDVETDAFSDGRPAIGTEIAQGELTPLDYLLKIMRNDRVSRAERLDAAKAAAPYFHAKRAPTKYGSDGPIDINSLSLRELVQLVSRIDTSLL
jgi:hypothetical protein